MILGDGTTTLDLPDELQWSDEMDWTALAVQDARGITGRTIRQESGKVAGRPITLAPPPDNWFGRVPYGTVRTLRDWSDTPGKTMTLVFANGDTFAVAFRYDGNGGPVKARPILGISERNDDELWLLTLNLTTTE